ncbi:DNA topoisomerase IV, alpha subunit [Cucurbitaria berberidis CBS 394.84]|uniref:DNA topoisomerase (ATP-hydrolyzing) n=1 Tax=Cucurbitaria berberidis CBS 394.84 TaxID=1168544 RepID=A0A9P4GMK6_9PLEO|nr:DNA topoisomerase IV, alpha subunit [Cucurbitaria berberidis CBS 394.84]KAF1848071.1 DNA topoisomerase IV, alpha subunit [Cucurbitaria berberidis CBS 394.84]
MNTDDFEDMLFGDLASQTFPDDALSNASEDDILFPLAEDDSILWELQNRPQLMPAPIKETPDKHSIDTEFSHIEVRSNTKLPTQAPPRDRHWVIARVEAMLERIVDGLLEESESLTITLKSRASLSRRRTNVLDSNGPPPEPKERDISFPGASAQEAWNFTVLLRILELVHGALLDDTVMTKRDIYYRHPDLFVKQSVVDRYVDDLACTFGITRSQLNITAAAKGLVAGNFTLTRECGHQVNVKNDKEGMLIPTVGDRDALDLTLVQWILVIEKEATFRTLLSSSQWESLGSCGVILTAKGYPDIATRKFLRQLADCAPCIPMYAFVDLDPDGIAILSTYKYGSYRLAHEFVAQKEAPAVGLPDIRWLGVKRNHLSRTPVGESDTGTNVIPELQGLMKLSPRDRTKAARMLEWDLCVEDGPEQGWRQELQTMLMLNVKAEMQILDELPGGMVSWLSNELDQASMPVSIQWIESTGSDDGMLF